MTETAIPVSGDFLEPAVRCERRDDGSLVLSSPTPLGSFPDQLGLLLRHWASAKPDSLFLAERAGEDWRRLSYGEVRARVDRLSAGLLARGLDGSRPVMILSGNSVNFALLQLAAMQVGIPVAPVSPAYSLMSQDHAKLKAIHALLRPALVYVEAREPFAAALAALEIDGAILLEGGTGLEALEAEPGEAVERAFAAVGPDSVAKILFTSGSTGLPKGVINTQRMLCANQKQQSLCCPVYGATPPVMLDWMPWNHTFGGNFNFNLCLWYGGSLYIDAGRPLPGLVEETVRNLREVSPTLYFSVPAGFAALLPFLEADEDLCRRFFARLKVIFYAGAALPADLWARLEALSEKVLGRRVIMQSAWGSTETAPLATVVHWPIDRAGVIGLPVPGVALKLVPAADKYELRVKGPNVFPGYLENPAQTETAFDGEGFYRIGDAGRLRDPDDPVQGIVFDGRVAEEFKLTTGTWVAVGAVRVAVLAACSPWLQDAVVAGHDRDYVALLAWPSARGAAADPAELRTALAGALAAYNAANPGSSTRVARLLLLESPPSSDANEITDKGYINQAAALACRADDVARLYAEPPDDAVIVV